MVAAIEASLRKAGFKVTRDSVAGRQAVIGRRRRLFVLVGLFKAGMAGRDHLDRFVEEAALYSSTVKGGLPSGVTAVAVAVLEGGGGTEGWAGATSQERRATVFPVLVDVPAGRVACPPAPADLHRLVQEHVVPSTQLV
ncbi:MAG TPA: hypothetical protein VNT52_10480 [Acidimicrobiales bacterium]|nr:hypothetical protein [Acidimicrobiales bacterium]